MDKITIKKRSDSKVGAMTGANTEVYLNGEKLKSCTGVKFEVKAASIAKIELEFVGEVELEGDFVVGQIERKTKKDLEMENESKES